MEPTKPWLALSNSKKLPDSIARAAYEGDFDTVKSFFEGGGVHINASVYSKLTLCCLLL